MTSAICPDCGNAYGNADAGVEQATLKAALHNHQKYCGKATVTRLPVLQQAPAVPALCRVCEDVRDLLDAGETHPEAVTWRLGKTGPALDKHLRRCGRADLLGRFTGRLGSAKGSPPPVPPPAEQPVGKRPAAGELLDHWDPEVVAAAAALVEAQPVLQSRWEAAQARRGEELAQLFAQRQQLEERIAALGGFDDRSLPEPPAVGTVSQPMPSAAQVRAWCRDNNVACSATGRVPRTAVDAYLDAHEPTGRDAS
jgi:hypothetical protein